MAGIGMELDVLRWDKYPAYRLYDVEAFEEMDELLEINGLSISSSGVSDNLNRPLGSITDGGCENEWIHSVKGS
jgi:hypothetical protein